MPWGLYVGSKLMKRVMAPSMRSLVGVMAIVAKAHMMLARFWGLLSARVDAA